MNSKERYNNNHNNKFLASTKKKKILFQNLEPIVVTA